MVFFQEDMERTHSLASSQARSAHALAGSEDASSIQTRMDAIATLPQPLDSTETLC